MITGYVPRQIFYPSLQGLRGFSALAVLTVHLSLMAQHGSFFPAQLSGAEPALSTLGQGVLLFFMISGFVIPASLFRHESVRKFLVDRMLRIMPLFLVLHLLVFTVGPFIGYKFLRDIDPLSYIWLFIANATFLAFPVGMTVAQQNSWTLTFEWGFYLSTCAAWLGLRNLRPLRIVYMVEFALAVTICTVFPVCIFFLIGLGFSISYFPSIRVPAAVELILLPLCLVLFFYLAQFINPLAASVPGLLLFWSALQPTTLTSRLLSLPLMQYLGKISYSLYLIHPVALFPFQFVGGRLVTIGFSTIEVFAFFIVLGVPSVFFLSVISYTFIEVSFRSWIASRLAATNWTSRLHAGPD